MIRKPGVYAIINSETNKMYIGSSKIIKSRIKSHLKALREGEHYNKELQQSWDKYGEKSFKFKVLKETNNQEEAVAREKKILKQFDKHNKRDKVFNTIFSRKEEEKESTLQTDKEIVHIGGLQVKKDLWLKFKAEATEKDQNRSEHLRDLLEERYGEGG